MVGVPGRSQACEPCRQRRVACNYTRPACGRCVKAKRSCAYRQGHIFVLNDEGTHKTVYRKPEEKPTTIESPLRKQYVASRRHQTAGVVDKAPSGNVKITGNRTITAPSIFQAPPPAKILQQGLVALAIAEGEHVKPHTMWGIIAQSLLIDSPTSFCAPPLACYALWRGRQNGEPALIDASHQLYIAGLVEVQKAMLSLKTATSDATLAACNALGLYEAMECPERTTSAYRWHRDACCRLIKLRGPAAHQEGVGHML